MNCKNQISGINNSYIISFLSFIYSYFLQHYILLCYISKYFLFSHVSIFILCYFIFLSHLLLTSSKLKIGITISLKILLILISLRMTIKKKYWFKKYEFIRQLSPFRNQIGLQGSTNVHIYLMINRGYISLRVWPAGFQIDIDMIKYWSPKFKFCRGTN